VLPFSTMMITEILPDAGDIYIRLCMKFSSIIILGFFFFFVGGYDWDLWGGDFVLG